MRLNRLKICGLGPFREEQVLDVDAVPGMLVALCGANGAGKSTALELFPGALSRVTPTRGSLVDLATTRGAYVEAEVVNGKRWTIRQTIDATSGKGESLVLDADGRPAFHGTGVRTFDAWAERHLPSMDVLLASTFSAQGSGGFLDLKASNRKGVLLRALGIERYEALAKTASERAKAARGQVSTKAELLRAERARSGDVAAEEATCGRARDAVAEAETALAVARAELARAEREAAAAAEAARRYEEAVAARAEQTQKLASARAAHAAIVARQNDGAALLAQADEIRAAAGQLAEAGAREDELRGARDRAEEAAIAADREAIEARRRAEAAEGRRAATQRRAAEQRRALQERIERSRQEIEQIERRIAADREGLLAQAEAIRAAAERLPGARDERAAAEADAKVLREEYSAAAVEARRHGEAAARDEALAASATAAGTIDRARVRAERERRLVTEATAALEPARAAIATADEDVARCRAEVERLEGTRIAGADGRIADLRGALSEIAVPTHTAGRAADDVAAEALRRDTEAAETAAQFPGLLATALAALEGAQDRRHHADRALGDIERAMERGPEAEAAEAALAELEAQAAARDAAAADERRLEREARARAEEIAGRGKVIAARAQELAAEVERLAPLAARAQELAGAEARIGGLQERAGELRREEQSLSEELTAAPADGGEEAAQAAEEVQAERSAAVGAETRGAEARKAGADARRFLDDLALGRARLEGLAARASDLAREEAIAPERAAQIEQAAATIAAIERTIAAIVAATTAPPPAPRDPADERAVAESAEGAVRTALAAAAVAEQRLEGARAGAERAAALEADLRAVDQEVADWERLAMDLGRDGLQALEIDAAGPELTELVNDLLRTCVGSRWTVTIEASRLSSDGKRELDGCEVRVLDNATGREAEASTFSGGERVILGEAVSLALSMIACRRAGVDGPTIVRDESGAALDADNGRAYVAMLRRAAEIVGASKVLFITHVPELQELADARIEIRDGRILCGGEAA